MLLQQISKQFKVLVTVCIVALLVTSCGGKKLDVIASDGTILAFGDSLTVGVGTSIENSYPTILAQLTGLTVINSGISGETTDRGLERLPAELDRTQPDLMILIEGGNDILRNKSKSQLKANLKGMIEQANIRSIPVVLIGIPEKSLFSDSAPLYEELAEEFDLVFDDSLIGGLQRSPSMKSDIVHFNKQGYRKMAESIYELLDDSGAL